MRNLKEKYENFYLRDLGLQQGLEGKGNGDSGGNAKPFWVHFMVVYSLDLHQTVEAIELVCL